MKLLLRLVLRAAVVNSLLLLGCSQGQRSNSSSAVPVVVTRPSVAASQAPANGASPAIKLIEVSRMGAAAEDQEVATVVAPAPSSPSPPLVVRASCDDAASPA